MSSGEREREKRARRNIKNQDQGRVHTSRSLFIGHVKYTETRRTTHRSVSVYQEKLPVERVDKALSYKQEERGRSVRDEARQGGGEGGYKKIEEATNPF